MQGNKERGRYMKYCTYCGEEVFDEAVICPHCGRQIAMFQQAKTKNIRTKVCKPINKRKIIKIALILFAALLLVAGVVLGFTFYKNHMYARELEGQLADKTYEYKGLNLAIEKIIGETDCLGMQLNAYPQSVEFNKKLFNRSIQENLIKKDKYNFSQETEDKFKKIIKFLKDHI